MIKRNDFCAKDGIHQVISLDRVYAADLPHPAINRMVCHNGSSWQDIGEAERPGFPPIDDQISGLIVGNLKPVILVDDGCWTGSSLIFLIRRIEARGARVAKVVVGLLIKRNSGDPFPVPLESFLSFPEEVVVDWVCERDFFLGVPLSGRTLGCVNPTPKCITPILPNTGVSYLLGFGDPVKWASLDFPVEQLREFSVQCLHRTIVLFEEVERCSGQPVLASDIERIPFGIVPRAERFSDILRREAKRVSEQAYEVSPPEHSLV